jgi:predicted O-methyltransferase YrrM
VTSPDSMLPPPPKSGIHSAPTGRAPGATLARLHRAHRGRSEMIAIVAMGVLSAVAFSGSEPLRLMAATTLAGLATAIGFALASEVRWLITQTASSTARQAESFRWLKSRLPLDDLRLPEQGYAANPDFLAELVHVIDQRGPKRVLELGSGVSTIVLAAGLRGEGQVLSLDHDRMYAQQTREQLSYHGVEATVIDAPLAPVLIAGRTWQWYTLPEGISDIDMLVVDGPPGNTGPLARYPALPLLYPLLSPGAVICVDDGIRADEREMVRMWLNEHPEMTWRYIATETGMYEMVVPPESGSGRASS